MDVPGNCRYTVMCVGEIQIFAILMQYLWNGYNISHFFYMFIAYLLCGFEYSSNKQLFMWGIFSVTSWNNSDCLRNCSFLISKGKKYRYLIHITYIQILSYFHYGQARLKLSTKHLYNHDFKLDKTFRVPIRWFCSLLDCRVI